MPQLQLSGNVSVPESYGIQQEHAYAKTMIHPLSQTTDRYIVGDRFHDGLTTSGHKQETCKYHNMKYCPELLNYQSVTSEVINSKTKSVRLQSSSQQNPAHYFFYNRLMDYWHNKEIVARQLRNLHSKIKDGEVIVRDCLYRMVYACQRCKLPGHFTTKLSFDTRCTRELSPNFCKCSLTLGVNGNCSKAFLSITMCC